VGAQGTDHLTFGVADASTMSLPFKRAGRAPNPLGS
jgi:hypothetical protein